MSQRIGGHADGRLYLRKGEAEGEGLSRIAVESEPLTFVLSPSRTGEATARCNDELFRR